MATKTLLTADEFFQTGPETDGFELVKGELVPMPPPGDRHGEVCANAAYLLKDYTRKVGYGKVIGNDAGLITRHDPDSVRGVDVAVFLKPDWKPVEGYGQTPPDLAIEVRSPAQGWKDVLTKVTEYLAMGVKLVWIIDPRVERITVFSPDHEPLTLAKENDIDGGTVLPGFRCQVAEFFA